MEQLEQRRLLDAVPVGPEFRVNSHTTRGQVDPVIGISANGDFVIAWASREQDEPANSGVGIYAQRFSAAGEPVGGEFRVSPNTPAVDVHHQPAIAMDPEGDFVVAWTDSKPGQYDYDNDVYARRYDAAGVPKGEAFRANASTIDSYSEPSVAVDADGRFVIAWTRQRYQTGPVFDVFAQRYTADGVAEGDEIDVGGGHWQDVAMDPDGNFVVAWTSRPHTIEQEIVARRYNAAGAAQGDAFRVPGDESWQSNLADVAFDPSGGFVIVWNDHRPSGFAYESYARRFNAAAVPLGDEFKVNSFTTDNSRAPNVAVDGTGAFTIAWDSLRDGSAEGIYARSFDANGVAKGLEFRVNTYTTARQGGPSIAMSPAGDFVVTWTSSSQDGSGDGVYAQRYAIPPTVTASAFLLQTSPQRLRFTFDRDVSASLGSDDVVLENLTTNQQIPSSDLLLTSYDAMTNAATFSYVGAGGGLQGVLPDGRYRATLLAGGVTTPAGAGLPGDHALSLLFLMADANNDGRVNLTDFNILAANFGQSDRDFTQGDFNYDGVVNLQDFNILASRFGKSIVPAAAATTATDSFGASRGVSADEEREELIAQ